jgi:hypothetical protein
MVSSLPYRRAAFSYFVAALELDFGIYFDMLEIYPPRFGHVHVWHSIFFLQCFSSEVREDKRSVRMGFCSGI